MRGGGIRDNTVEAVVAPALRGAVGGASGGPGYRVVNTLDSMIGRQSPRHQFNAGQAERPAVLFIGDVVVEALSPTPRARRTATG